MSSVEKYSIEIKVPCSQSMFKKDVVLGLEKLKEDSKFIIYIKGHSKYETAHLNCLKDRDLYRLRLGLIGKDEVRRLCKNNLSFNECLNELHTALTTGDNYDFQDWDIIPD